MYSVSDTQNVSISTVIKKTDMDTTDTVSAEILMDVFGDEPLPFRTNPNGSVARSIYQAWFDGVAPELRRAALHAFDEHSEVIIPDGCSAVETYRLDE